MCDIKRCFNQSKCSLTCKHEKGLSKHEKGLSKHEKGLSKHEKGLSEHEKGLSDLNQSKMYRQFVTKGSNYQYLIMAIFSANNDPNNIHGILYDCLYLDIL